MASNPLLEIPFEIPFDQIKAEHVEPAIARLLDDARRGVEAIASAAGKRTYENTLGALDLLGEPLSRAMSVVRHLEAVATYPELRAAFNAVQEPVSEFYSSIPLHEGLWMALRSYAAGPEAAACNAVRRRFLTKTIDNFRRHGAELDQAGKARLKEIDIELTKLTTKFGENVLDSTNEYELVIAEEAGLAGLPPSAVAAARQSARSKGIEGWRFTLHAPSYLPLITYLDDARLREEVYRAFNTRACSGRYDNRPLIARLLQLREEKAKLLGYADFADFVLEDRMAHKGGEAERFVENLRRLTEPYFARERESLLAFRRSIEGECAPPLQPWDLAYYAEKQRKALYDFDEEALRPYFPLPRVLQGMFEIFGRLLGIRVVEKPGAAAWDPAVTFYEIRDAVSGGLLGAFYADFFPRENKRPGAWMDAFITGGPAPGGFEPHLGAICGNLTPPVDGTPSLLTHLEVETVFHEFGHLLHHCLSEVEVRSLSGTNVAWDFVELPSQILENWCWERETLDLFARHWETGECIPEDLYQSMRRARTFRAATAQMRQLGFGLLDLALHRHYSPAVDGDPVAYTRRILQEFTPAPLPEEHAMAAGFTHLFSSPVGYAAGYYSYKWAEVLDADAFTRFKAEGVLNPDVGGRYRAAILARGDGEDPAELYRLFMGRDPDPRALLERCGLLDGSEVSR